MLISRRSVLATGTATGLAAASLPTAVAEPSLGNPDSPAQGAAAIENNRRSSSIVGPQDPAMADQLPSSLMPPSTDHGSIPNFWFSFNQVNRRVQDGGWARQVTTRELPISTTIAGVNMRLTAGGIREMHWHQQTEWAFVTYGNARVTVLDPEGRIFINDVREGDLWTFPSGYPHSIQGLEPDGTEFLLIFDNGNFSEYDTFLPTEWMSHTPPEVLTKNFGLPRDAFANIPLHQLYIFQGQVPPPLSVDRQSLPATPGFTQKDYTYHLLQQKPDFSSPAGEVRIVQQSNFPASNAISAAHVVVHPGAMREMHWHPNADEWQYYIAGQGRMGVFAAGGNIRTRDFHTGDVGYVPQTMGHYIENTGNTDLVFFEIFRSTYYSSVSFSEWLSHLPPELVKAHFNFSDSTIAAIPKNRPTVVGAPQHG